MLKESRYTAETDPNEQRAVEQLQSETTAIQQEIAELKEKVVQVSDVATLDSLQDELAERQLLKKTLELTRRTLADDHRNHLKLLHQSEVMLLGKKFFWT